MALSARDREPGWDGTEEGKPQLQPDSAEAPVLPTDSLSSPCLALLTAAHMGSARCPGAMPRMEPSIAASFLAVPLSRSILQRRDMVWDGRTCMLECSDGQVGSNPGKGGGGGGGPMIPEADHKSWPLRWPPVECWITRYGAKVEKTYPTCIVLCDIGDHCVSGLLRRRRPGPGSSLTCAKKQRRVRTQHNMELLCVLSPRWLR